MEQKKDIKIRKMQERDALCAARIEAENFSKPWTEEGFRKAVQDKAALYLTALVQEEVAGYAGMWIALDEGEITNVSVKKEFQGMGLGRKLMYALEEAGKNAGVCAYFLEVRESNERAIRLYESCGFVQMGIRRNFYEAPCEDAVVMCRR